MTTNSDSGPFGPFDPSPLPVAAPEAPKRRRRQAGTKNKPKGDSRPQSALTPLPTSAAAGAVNANGLAGPTLKVDLVTAMRVNATLKPDDHVMFTHLAVTLSGLRADARARILVALGQVFA